MTRPPVAQAATAFRAPGRKTSATCWAVGTLGPGSPGATTLAVAIAGHVGGVLVEADADGGVLGARYGGWLNERAPSLASLLAALDDARGAAIEDHLQRLPGGARAVLVAPDVERALGPVRRLGEDLGRLRDRLRGQTLVLDVGRVRPDTPSQMLAEGAGALVAVVRPQVDSLGCLLARLPVLVEGSPRIVLAVRGNGPYSLADIRAAIQMRTTAPIPVVGVPDDPRGVRALNQVSTAGRSRWGGGRANALAGAAGALATILTGLDPERAEPPTPGQGRSGRPVSGAPGVGSEQSRRTRAAP